MLNAPEIRLCGFVDNIDDEMAPAPVFLSLNNAGACKVEHARYSHAWPFGAAVVAHPDVALSMPELVDGENCLLGGSGDLVEQTAQALDDRDPHWYIGEAGCAMFRDKFTADRVAAEIIARTRRALALQDPAA